MAEFAIVAQAARTGSTGTQDFTVSGFGTPKAVLFFGSHGTVAGTRVDHAGLFVGMTDGRGSGTYQFSTAVRAEDGSASDATSNPYKTYCLVIPDATTSTKDGSATFDSWITDGVRINWDDVPANGVLVTAVLMGGAGIANAYCGVVTPSGTLDASVDVTAPGFTPTVVVTCANIANFNGTPDSNIDLSLGFVVNDGANTQRSANWHHVTPTVPTVLAAVLDGNSVARRASGVENGPELQIQDFDANGFSVYSRVSVSAPFQELAYLALQFSGLTATVRDDASPTGTGDETITGAGFTPQFALLLHTSTVSVGTAELDADAEVFGLSAITTPAQACAGCWDQDNVNPANCESLTDTKAIALTKNGAAFTTATFSSWTGDGLTLNYTVTDSTARQRAVLFVQNPAPPSGADSVRVAAGDAVQPVAVSLSIQEAG